MNRPHGESIYRWRSFPPSRYAGREMSRTNSSNDRFPVPHLSSACRVAAGYKIQAGGVHIGPLRRYIQKYTNACPSGGAMKTRPWTVMVYMQAADDAKLEAAAIRDLKELEKA